MHRHIHTCILVILSVFMLSLHADKVVCADDSVLNGTVKGVAGGKLKLGTEFAGTLTIAMDKIKSVTTDTEYKVELASGSTLVGSLTQEQGKTYINTVNGSLDISSDKIKSIYGKDEVSPEVLAIQKNLRKWSYEASFDLNGRTGNSERYSFAGGAKAMLKGPNDSLTFYTRGRRVEDDGNKSADEILGGLDFESKFAKRHSWYVRGEVEQDDIEGLDLRTTVASGYGYYFIQEDNQELRGRVGMLFRHESWKDESLEDNSSAGVDLGLYHMYKSEDDWRLTNEITVEPSLEDVNNLRLYHESKIEFPLKSERMKFALGISNEDTSPTPDDVKQLDTYYFARLILSWR